MRFPSTLAGFVALVVALLAVCIGLRAAFAYADNPHPPGCKGDPHKCVTTTSADPTPPTVTVIQADTTNTVTSTTVAPGVPVIVTQPVVIQVGKATVTVVPKIKTKIVRRWCSRQRHGWRCYAKRPPYAPHR